MPSPVTLIKQPAESRLYVMDFSANLAAGETIASVTSFTSDAPTGAATLTISSIAAASDGLGAQARVAGGSDGARYKLTALVTTNMSNILEGEGYLQVRDL